MNVKLTNSASAAPGTTVTPELLELEEPALALGEERPVDEVFTLSCQEPSMHSFEFVNTIEPLDPADTDPDLSNNEATIQIDVECVVQFPFGLVPVYFHRRPPARPLHRPGVCGLVLRLSSVMT